MTHYNSLFLASTLFSFGSFVVLMKFAIFSSFLYNFVFLWCYVQQNFIHKFNIHHDQYRHNAIITFLNSYCYVIFFGGGYFTSSKFETSWDNREDGFCFFNGKGCFMFFKILCFFDNGRAFPFPNYKKERKVWDSHWISN